MSHDEKLGGKVMPAVPNFPPLPAEYRIATKLEEDLKPIDLKEGKEKKEKKRRSRSRSTAKRKKSKHSDDRKR